MTASEFPAVAGMTPESVSEPSSAGRNAAGGVAASGTSPVDGAATPAALTTSVDDGASVANRAAPGSSTEPNPEK